MLDLGITDLKRLTSVIKEKYSYDFSNYATASFKRRIIRIMELQKLNSLEVLISRINEDEFKKDDFLSEVTVNVTEMFRDPSYWKTLKNVLPDFINSSTKDTITIWHAGCSSGEEVYTMLILLNELNLLDRTRLIATDIDKKILAEAKSGKIATKNMELNDSNYIKYGGKNLYDYFTPSNAHFILDLRLMEHVSFREVDLASLENFPVADVILCRNVLIYFNQVLKNEVLKTMYTCLPLQGLLSIGSKETLSWTEVSNIFFPVSIEEKIYRKLNE